MLKAGIFLALVAVFTYLALNLVREMGVFKQFYKHHPGTCRKINGKEHLGFEDFHVTNYGLVFISSGVSIPQLGKLFTHVLPKGRILTYDLSKPERPITELPIRRSPEVFFDQTIFRPHGISVLEDKSKGEHLLYAVSHPPSGPERVEKFRYIPRSKELVHLMTFKSDKMHMLNDVLVVKEDVFYATDFIRTTHPSVAGLEYMSPLALGSVLLFHGLGVETAVSGLRHPNSFQMSPNGKHVYLSHNEHLAIFTRNPENDSLTLTQNVELHTAPDNLQITHKGDAIISAGHPILGKLFEHFDDPLNVKSPSQVLHIPLEDGLVKHQEDISELLYDHGDLISASTVASVHNNLLLVGGVLNNLVICDLNGPRTAPSSGEDL